jgi:hypothetical protein
LSFLKIQGIRRIFVLEPKDGSWIVSRNSHRRLLKILVGEASFKCKSWSWRTIQEQEFEAKIEGLCCLYSLWNGRCNLANSNHSIRRCY